MEDNQQHLEALKDIRQMMQRSNKFLSLSGLSGVFAGAYALIGAFIGMQLINNFSSQSYKYYDVNVDISTRSAYSSFLFQGTVVCALVLLASLVTAYILSFRKAKKNHQSFFDRTALRLMVNMLIPLTAGGLFCIAMLIHGGSMILLVCPAMLIFYGLALVNSSKYTLDEIRYLGCLEILLGIIAVFYLGYGIIFWSIGFGVLHIVYGTWMWFKYDRKG